MGSDNSTLNASPHALAVTQLVVQLTDEDVRNITMAYRIDKKSRNLKPLQRSKQEQMILIERDGVLRHNVDNFNEVLIRIGRQDVLFPLQHDGHNVGLRSPSSSPVSTTIANSTVNNSNFGSNLGNIQLTTVNPYSKLE